MPDDKPHIALIAFMYPPDNYSGAARPYRFAKYLERMGYPVTVLAAGTSTKPVVSGNVHRVRGEFEFIQKDFAAFCERLARKFFFPHDGGTTWGARAARYGKRLLRDMPRPVILSTSPPLITHAVAYGLKKKFGAPWIADFRDPFAGMPWRTSRWARTTDFPFERLIFRNAGAVIANTDATAEMWHARYPAMRDRIHLIWNGFDPEEEIGPAPVEDSGTVTLAHVGDIYGARHPGLVLGAVDRLSRCGAIDPRRFRIRLTGPLDRSAIEDPQLFDALVARGTIQLEPRVSRQDSHRVMATATYLLALDVFHSAPPLQLPAKIFDYVRVGRPILACTRRNSPLAYVLAMSGLRFVCLYEDDRPAEVDRKLLEFLQFPPEPLPLAPEFLSVFDGARQAAHLAGIIDAVTGRRAQTAAAAAATR